MSIELYVTASGVALATGHQARALLLATQAGLPLLAQDPTLPLILPGRDEAPIPVLLRYSDDPEHLSKTALPLLQEKASEEHPVLVLLPDPAEPQYPLLKAALHPLEAIPGLKWVHPAALPDRLGAALNDLEQGRIQQFTLFGIDSLVGSPLLSAWLQQGRLRTQYNPDGRATGEGWGWFTLSRTAPEQQPAIRWQTGEWATEPASTHNTAREYHGLALSLAPLLQQALPGEPDTWVYSRRQTPEDDLEAFMAFQYHWGNTGYDHLEHLCPARCIGDLGVAALPVAVALACERLAFKPYRKTSVVVSDSHPDGRHFSLLLSTQPLAQSSP